MVLMVAPMYGMANLMDLLELLDNINKYYPNTLLKYNLIVIYYLFYDTFTYHTLHEFTH